MRVWIGTMLIKAGMAIIPRDVRDLVRGLLAYHIPGALTEDEKEQVRVAKTEARLQVQSAIGGQNEPSNDLANMTDTELIAARDRAHAAANEKLEWSEFSKRTEKWVRYRDECYRRGIPSRQRHY